VAVTGFRGLPPERLREVLRHHLRLRVRRRAPRAIMLVTTALHSFAFMRWWSPPPRVAAGRAGLCDQLFRAARGQHGRHESTHRGWLRRAAAAAATALENRHRQRLPPDIRQREGHQAVAASSVQEPSASRRHQRHILPPVASHVGDRAVCPLASSRVSQSSFPVFAANARSGSRWSPR